MCEYEALRPALIISNGTVGVEHAVVQPEAIISLQLRSGLRRDGRR